MFNLKRKSAMPSATEALPGRATPIPTASKHFLNGHDLKGPYPEGLETAAGRSRFACRRGLRAYPVPMESGYALLHFEWRMSLSENRSPPSLSQGHAFPGHALVAGIAYQRLFLAAEDHQYRGHNREHDPDR